MKPRKQSAVIPYLVQDGELFIVLIKSKHKGNWGIPKGKIEDNLTAKKSAEVEAYEEAGLKGKVGKKLGEYVYTKGSTQRAQHVKVYAMRVDKVLSKYPEVEWRTRKAFRVSRAMDKLPSAPSKILKEFVRGLNVSNLSA